MRDTGEVLVDEGTLPLLAHLLERRIEPAAGVVDQHIDPAVLALDGAEPGPHRLAVAYVEDAGHAAAANGLHVAGRRGHALSVPVADREVGTESGQCRRGRGADPLRRSRHDRDSPVEGHRVGAERHRYRTWGWIRWPASKRCWPSAMASRSLPSPM